MALLVFFHNTITGSFHHVIKSIRFMSARGNMIFFFEFLTHFGNEPFFTYSEGSLSLIKESTNTTTNFINYFMCISFSKWSRIWNHWARGCSRWCSRWSHSCIRRWCCRFGWRWCCFRRWCCRFGWRSRRCRRWCCWRSRRCY